MSKDKAKHIPSPDTVLSELCREACAEHGERMLEWNISPNGFTAVACDISYMNVPSQVVYFPGHYPYPPKLMGILHGIEVFEDISLPPRVIELRTRDGEVVATTDYYPY